MLIQASLEIVPLEELDNSELDRRPKSIVYRKRILAQGMEPSFLLYFEDVLTKDDCGSESSKSILGWTPATDESTFADTGQRRCILAH